MANKRGVLMTAQKLMVFSLLLAACGTPPKVETAQKAAPPEAKSAPAPAQVTAWQGAAPVETGPFSTASPEWTIRYATRRNPGSTAVGEAQFQLYVHSADSGRIVALAANTASDTESTYQIQTPPGRYYLRINASAPWTVALTGIETKAP
jgi:hypothetical protein